MKPQYWGRYPQQSSRKIFPEIITQVSQRNCIFNSKEYKTSVELARILHSQVFWALTDGSPWNFNSFLKSLIELVGEIMF